MISLEEIKLQLEELDQDVIQSFNVLKDFSSKEFLGSNRVAELTVKICGRPTVLSVGFSDLFPSTLPDFYDKENNFVNIPHRMSDGLLCFTRNESLIIDERFPASILLNCLERVIKLIEDGLNKINFNDFIKEFEVYWDKSSILDIYAYIDVTNKKTRELNLWKKETENTKSDFIFIASESKNIKSSPVQQIFNIDLNSSPKFRCIYFPLDLKSFIMPPIDEESVWDFKTLKDNIFSNLSEENKKEFFRITKQAVRPADSVLEFIIVGLPISNDDVALFGCCLSANKFNLNSFVTKRKNRKQVHPFIIKPKDVKIFQASLKRWHQDFLLNRAGGNLNLKNKRVLIAGLGSVGSEVAIRFAKAGVENLSLVDYDDLQFDNIHRHALGIDQVFKINKEKAFVNKPKIEGMKEEIERKYPFTRVDIYENSIIKMFDLIESKEHPFDLVVVAIGVPNLEMLINKKLYQMAKPPTTIYTWVEPLGIGGHTLITFNNGSKGCYQCLFQQAEDEPIFNRSAFAKPFQDFSKSITGCGSVFTPYSFLDSERSAMLTVENGIKVLIGELEGNPLLSWKGDNSLFRNHQYETTNRFLFGDEQLFKNRYQYIDKNCVICSREGVIINNEK